MAYDFYAWLNSKIFVIHRESKKIIKVFSATERKEAVNFIDSFPVPERYGYSTAQRNTLATMGWYPKTKKGNLELERDLAELKQSAEQIHQEAK